MADNITAPATGETFATEEIGGRHIPLNKLVTGGPGVNGGPVTPANPLPVSQAGVATEATLAALNAKLTTAQGVPDGLASGLVVRPVGQETWVTSFAQVGAGLIAPEFRAPDVGTGVGVSQAGGSLLITTGIDANAEFLTRSLSAWQGTMQLRWSSILSQRIANQNFQVLLADLIGENLATTINSTTSITVSLPGHPYTAANVGQSMMVGGITGAAGVPGRYAIASVVPGVSITFTVAGWPASGSCTLDLFGHSFARALYTGTTATNMNIDAQRRGWASGDTVATINTTAAPGHIGQVHLAGREAFFSDMLRASSVTPNMTVRGSRVENLPDEDLELYLFIWVFNGPTAPASTTTWTVGFVAVETFANLPVYVQGQEMQGAAAAAPVAIVGTPAVNVAGTPTIVGPAAHDAAISGAPNRIAGRAATTNYATVAAGDTADVITTLVGAQVTKPYATPEQGWSNTLALTTTAAQPLQPALAGNKRHITALQAINTGAAAVDLIILDGATERWRMTLPINVPLVIPFPTELITTANTALNANLSAAGTVRVNAQGYTAP